LVEDNYSGGKNQAVFMVMPQAKELDEDKGYIHQNIVFLYLFIMWILTV